MIVLDGYDGATVDGSGAGNASGNLVAGLLLVNGESVADERKFARELAGASERPIKKSRKLRAES